MNCIIARLYAKYDYFIVLSNHCSKRLAIKRKHNSTREEGRKSEKNHCVVHLIKEDEFNEYTVMTLHLSP